MGKNPCDKFDSDIEIDKEARQQLQRVDAALDGMTISDIQLLVDEIEAESQNSKIS